MHVEVTLYHLYAGVPVLVNTPRGTVGVVFEPKTANPLHVSGAGVRGPKRAGDLIIHWTVLFPPAGDPHLTQALATLQACP